MKAEKIKIKNFDDYRQKWDGAINAKFLSDFPIHIDLELTSNCNLKCEMCWQSKDPDAFARGFMSKKLFIRPSFFKITSLLFIKDLFFLLTLFIDISTNEPGLTFNSFLNDLNSEIILMIFSTSF